MSRLLGNAFGVVVVLFLLAAPAALAVHQQRQTRHFREVRAGVLYRSGQMTLAGLRRVVHDYGIKTVISLRDGRSAADRDEEAYCNKEEITFVRLPPRSWGDDPRGEVPVEANVRKFREVMADPRNHPVLVHCFAGTHRTGAYCAIFRMEHEHWSNERAVAEVKACGYKNLDEELDVLGYLEQYRPAWKAQAGPAGQARSH
jgi:tyrosine-protein phosphatase SIW14